MISNVSQWVPMPILGLSPPQVKCQDVEHLPSVGVVETQPVPSDKEEDLTKAKGMAKAVIFLDTKYLTILQNL